MNSEKNSRKCFIILALNNGVKPTPSLLYGILTSGGIIKYIVIKELIPMFSTLFAFS